MNSFINTCSILHEDLFHKKQIFANTAWGSGGTIIGIFSPVNSSVYPERLHMVRLIHDKTSKKIQQLSKEKESPIVLKKINLMKLLNAYSIKIFNLHNSYVLKMKKLKTSEQKREFRKEYKQILIKLEKSYEEQKSKIKRSYKLSA